MSRINDKSTCAEIISSTLGDGTRACPFTADHASALLPFLYEMLSSTQEAHVLVALTLLLKLLTTHSQAKNLRIGRASNDVRRVVNDLKRRESKVGRSARLVASAF